MKLGEVCLLTQDVPRLANFYKALLETDNRATIRCISISSAATFP